MNRLCQGCKRKIRNSVDEILIEIFFCKYRVFVDIACLQIPKFTPTQFPGISNWLVLGILKNLNGHRRGIMVWYFVGFFLFWWYQTLPPYSQRGIDGILVKERQVYTQKNPMAVGHLIKPDGRWNHLWKLVHVWADIDMIISLMLEGWGSRVLVVRYGGCFDFF